MYTNTLLKLEGVHVETEEVDIKRIKFDAIYLPVTYALIEMWLTLFGFCFVLVNAIGHYKLASIIILVIGSMLTVSELGSKLDISSVKKASNAYKAYKCLKDRGNSVDDLYLSTLDNGKDVIVDEDGTELFIVNVNRYVDGEKLGYLLVDAYGVEIRSDDNDNDDGETDEVISGASVNIIVSGAKIASCKEMQAGEIYNGEVLDRLTYVLDIEAEKS